MDIPKADGELSSLEAEFFKGLAHPTRIRLLRALEFGEKSVNLLAKSAGVTQANASQHLAILRRFGVLDTRRDGSTVYYRIGDKKVLEAYELVRRCVGERVKSRFVISVSP